MPRRGRAGEAARFEHGRAFLRIMAERLRTFLHLGDGGLERFAHFARRGFGEALGIGVELLGDSLE